MQGVMESDVMWFKRPRSQRSGTQGVKESRSQGVKESGNQRCVPAASVMEIALGRAFRTGRRGRIARLTGTKRATPMLDTLPSRGTMTADPPSSGAPLMATATAAPKPKVNRPRVADQQMLIGGKWVE